MSKLAAHLRKSIQDAVKITPATLVQPTLETHLSDLASFHLDRDVIALEKATGDLVELEALGEQARALLVTVESIETTTPQVLALTQLSINGLYRNFDLGEAPSLEADDTDGRAKLKATLQRIWDAIVKAAAIAWDMLRKIFKSLTDAEKALYMEVARLRTAVRGLDDKITRSASVPNTIDMVWASDAGDMPENYAALSKHLEHYASIHGVIHLKYAPLVRDTIKKLGEAIHSATTPADLTKAVLAAHDAIKALDPAKINALFPNTSAASDGRHVLPLTYDRQLVIVGESLPASGDADFEAKAKSIELRVEQYEVDVQGDLGAMKAMTAGEIEKILGQLDKLLSSGTRSDSASVFLPIRAAAEQLKSLTEQALKKIESVKDEDQLKGENGETIQQALRQVMNFNTLATRWAAAPFGKFDTVTVHLVRAVLRICRAHAANYRGDTAS